MTDLRSELAWLVERFNKYLWCVEHEWGGPIDDYKREEARAEAILKLTDWQPIETAPTEEWATFLAFGKDGVILVSREGSEFWSLGYRCSETKEYLGLTHWMPLPDPPA